MSRVGYWDNAERRTTFRDLLKAYDIYGWKARIHRPFTMDGTLVDQRGEGPGAIFVIQLADKIKWNDFAKEAGWMDSGGYYSGDVGPRFNADLQRLGFIEDDGRDEWVTHMWSQWAYIELLNLQKGQPVEYVENDYEHVSSIKSTPGIVSNVIIPDHPNAGQFIVELFVIHPLSWVRIPRAMDTDYLKPEHISSWTDRILVRSTYLNWKEKFPASLPAGDFSSDKKEFIFNEAIPLDQVKGICKSTLTNEELILRCWLGSAMFHIVPIVYGHSGTFRPMRKEVARESVPYVVTKKDIDDALKRGEHFEQNPVYPEQWGVDPQFHVGSKVMLTKDIRRLGNEYRAGWIGTVADTNMGKDGGFFYDVEFGEDPGENTAPHIAEDILVRAKRMY